MEFCPGIYEHAAAVVGRTPWEVSRSPDLLVEAHASAWDRYRHPLVVAGIDVYNVEPEALGAGIREPRDANVPAISRHSFSEFEECLELPPFDPAAGRIGMVIEAAGRLKDRCPGGSVRVPICGPMAMAGGLLGIENLLVGLVEDVDLAREAFDALSAWQCGFLEEIAGAGLRPVFFESGATPPLLPVPLFEEVEAPMLADLFDTARRLFGEDPPCIIGGDAAPIASALLAARPGYVIAPSETDQAAFLEEASRHPGVHVRVNLAATALVPGKEDLLGHELERVCKLVAGRSRVSVGCGVVPYEADPAVVQQLGEIVMAWPVSGADVPATRIEG